MKKETLQLANELDYQIRQMENALKILSSPELNENIIAECLYECRSLGDDVRTELISMVKDLIESKINVLIIEKKTSLINYKNK